MTAILPPLHPSLEAELVRVYAEESGLPAGEGVGVLRDVVVVDTDDHALALWGDSGVFCGAAWFAPFGFTQGLVDPTTGEAPDADDLLASGVALVGSVDTVTRQLEALLERLPVRWLFAWTYNALIPHSALMHSIEAFATKVLPRVADPKVAL